MVTGPEYLRNKWQVAFHAVTDDGQLFYSVISRGANQIARFIPDLWFHGLGRRLRMKRARKTDFSSSFYYNTFFLFVLHWLMELHLSHREQRCLKGVFDRRIKTLFLICRAVLDSETQPFRTKRRRFSLLTASEMTAAQWNKLEYPNLWLLSEGWILT